MTTLFNILMMSDKTDQTANKLYPGHVMIILKIKKKISYLVSIHCETFRNLHRAVLIVCVYVFIRLKYNEDQRFLYEIV